MSLRTVARAAVAARTTVKPTWSPRLVGLVGLVGLTGVEGLIRQMVSAFVRPRHI
jgi:hypothetical protein